MKFRSLLTQRHDAEEIDESGFTLIELLIVVVIMGILAAVVAFAVGSFASTSAVAACNTDAKSVQTAVSAEYAEAGAWTTDLSSLSTSANGGPYLHAPPSNPAYVISLVKDATTGATDVYVALTSTDPGYNDTTATPAGTAVNYDTTAGVFTTGGFPATSNICAGA